MGQEAQSIDILELTKHLCQMVVKKSDAVEVSRSGSTRTIIVTARVADEDVGRVIGKQGGTIKAIRCLLEQAGRRQNNKVFFELANKEANRQFKKEKQATSETDTNAETDTTTQEASLASSDAEMSETLTSNE